MDLEDIALSGMQGNVAVKDLRELDDGADLVIVVYFEDEQSYRAFFFDDLEEDGWRAIPVSQVLEEEIPIPVDLLVEYDGLLICKDDKDQTERLNLLGLVIESSFIEAA